MRPFEIRVPAVERGGARLPALLLSAPTGADIDRIAEICRDADIQEWTTVPRGYTRADAESFVTGTVASGWESGKDLSWAVREDREEGAPVLVGMMGLAGGAGGVWEIGYWLDPAARGRGTVSRAARTLIGAAFEADGPLRARALRWRCDIHDGVPNWASWRVAWGLGFRREGRVRSLLANDGALHDGWIATLLPEDPREPRAPWDGPVVEGRAAGSSHSHGAATPLVPADGVGEREGDDPEALVRRFHRLYGLPIRTDGPSLERESLHMRMSLIAEEFAELTGAVYGSAARAEAEAAYARAVAADDGRRSTVEAADALADLVYVVYGMALETGIDLAAVLAEVQRSNMSKLGPDGRPVYREDGKVLKGPGYVPPDVAGALGIGRGPRPGGG